MLNKISFSGGDGGEDVGVVHGQNDGAIGEARDLAGLERDHARTDFELLCEGLEVLGGGGGEGAEAEGTPCEEVRQGAEEWLRSLHSQRVKGNEGRRSSLMVQTVVTPSTWRMKGKNNIWISFTNYLSKWISFEIIYPLICFFTIIHLPEGRIFPKGDMTQLVVGQV